jgi:hypothetical protein
MRPIAHAFASKDKCLHALNAVAMGFLHWVIMATKRKALREDAV